MAVWRFDEPELYKYGEEWIVRASKPSNTPLFRRTVAVTMRREGMSKDEAAIKAKPLLEAKVAEQEARDRSSTIGE